jgi:hypothetical protein
MQLSALFGEVLNRALREIQAATVPVFTFALYYDHESMAVSVCVDTEENSNKTVHAINGYNMKYFMDAIAAGDLSSASLWQANIGRSLSLGDFALVNVARTSLEKVHADDQFYVELVRSLAAVQDRVAVLSPARERLVLACSGADDEVAYVWSLPTSAA